MSRTIGVFYLTVALVLSMCVAFPLLAAQPSDPGKTSSDNAAERTWGGTQLMYLSIPAQAFQANDSITPYAYYGNGYIGPTGSGSWFGAPLTLPSGALLGGVRLYYYNNTGTPGTPIQLQINKYTGSSSPNTTGLVHFLTTGTGYSSEFVLASETIRYGAMTEDSQSYVIWVNMPGGVNQSFKGVRIVYSLQISPAPGTATFSDVPTTHPFFQHVEALYAAGITTGYGSTGTYHPDD